MRRSLDVLDAPAGRQVFRRHVRPGLAVIARDVKRTIIRTGPDHALLQRRLRNRIQRAVKLFARNIACDLPLIMYEKFQELDGTHPWRDVSPDGYIDYRARYRPQGRVIYFNFPLAMENRE